MAIRSCGSLGSRPLVREGTITHFCVHVGSKVMKKSNFLTYLTFVTFSSLPSFTALAEEPRKTNPDLVAKVNGAVITVKMLNQAMEERIPATGHRTLSEKRLAEIKKQELDKLIIRELLLQEAQRRGIKADSGEVESELSKIKGRFPSEKEFRRALHRQGLTPTDVHKGLERHLLIQKLLEKVHSTVTVSPEELKRYYDEHPDQFVLPEAVRLRQILIKVDPGGSRQDWEEGQKKARDLVAQARQSSASSGGSDFAGLARQYSEDETTRSQGGNSGLLHRGMMEVKEVEEAAFTLPVGEVSQPIQTLHGYLIIKVEERQPAKQLSFSEINKDLLKREMEESARQRSLLELIADLKAKAEITIY